MKFLIFRFVAPAAVFGLWAALTGSLVFTICGILFVFCELGQCLTESRRAR